MIAARRASSGSEAMQACRAVSGFTDQLVEQLDQRVAQLGGGAGVQLGV